MKIKEAVNIACKESTLLDALTWICIWESERIVKQAKKNQRDMNGKGWDTCFRYCLNEVMDKYPKPIGPLTRLWNWWCHLTGI